MRPASLPPADPSSRPRALSTVDGVTSQEILRRFRALPAPRLALLRIAAEIAPAAGCDLYWVGGGVRDLWLGTSELDIDLVVDGELDPFASRFAAALGGELRLHLQFLTAEIATPEGPRIDLARARTEAYPSPASLPVVAPGAIETDLERRDFTINCLAIALAPGFGERLIDPCNGLADLAEQRLRTLHPDSFRDDPTRILRGLELAARFGFELAATTLAEVEAARAGGWMARLSPARLGEAMRRALGRPASAAGVLRRLRELRLLEAVDCSLVQIGDAEERFDAALRQWGERFPAVGEDGSERGQGTFRLALLCLAFDLAAEDRRRLSSRLALQGADRELVALGPDRVREAALRLAGEVRPSTVHALLRGWSEEELAVLAAQGGGARSWVRRECSELRSVRLEIGGRDLLAAGLAAGPALGRALELTLKAKLDGRIGAGGELAFALRSVRGAGEGA
jgi:tRNA nucleotidyltransferase (CCA-adding enzyme)